jgi:glucose-6-phosphate 1-epimerase
MHLALCVKNTGDEPFTMSGALHSYFAVGEITQVTVDGLDGVEYLDTVGTKEVRHQNGAVRFDREVDRNYHSSDDITIQDASLRREITVQRSGSHTAVVWNPWIEKSKALTDLPDEDYHRFVCVETANAWRDHIIVPAGGQHTLATSVRVS